MNIHEYQAKRIFKSFGITVPNGLIAYTPSEALEAAKAVSGAGPWVVKAQIQAGSRDVGKFSDKRAGRTDFQYRHPFYTRSAYCLGVPGEVVLAYQFGLPAISSPSVITQFVHL